MIIKLLTCAAATFAFSAYAADFGHLDSRVEGRVALNPATGAVFVQFAGSPTITEAVRRDLATHGYAIALNKADAKQVLTMKGVVSVSHQMGKQFKRSLAPLLKASESQLRFQ